jgi:hypothetical protein
VKRAGQTQPAKRPGWTAPADVVAVLRRRWDTGRYLKAFARGDEWEPIVLPVRGPNADELLHRFEEVRNWVAAFEAGIDRSFQIEYRTLGSRHVGTNRIPVRVRVPDFAALCSLLRTVEEARVLEQLMARTRARLPVLTEWAAAHPLAVLEHRDVWDRVLATVEWIGGRDSRAMYVRQLDVEGVDTKFVERHQKILSELLPLVLAPERVDPSQIEFARRFRFLSKPLYTRFRFLDPSLSPFPAGITEVSLRTDELAGLNVGAATVFVVENEVTYLALPRIHRAVAVFGGGFASAGLTGIPWLREREIVYWGDIDTYGFDILSRLRSSLPQVRSILMDRETLLFHRAHWSIENSPTRRPLAHLSDTEEALYQDLISDVYGIGVRLEQERVRFSKVQEALLPWARADD